MGAALRRRLLRGLLAALVGTLATLAAADDGAVSVESAAGIPIPGALVSCIDPLGEVRVADGEGVARFDERCAWARCEAEGFLPTRVALRPEGSLCRLEEALLLEVEVPPEAEPGVYHVTLEAGERAEPLEQQAKPGELVRFPPLAPSALTLTLARDDWKCRTRLDGETGATRVRALWSGPRRVSGRVADADGVPLAGVALHLEPAASRWRCGAGESRPVLTDDEGRFAFEAALAQPARLVATAPGWERAVAWVAPDRAEARSFVLEPLYESVLHVVDEEGTPLRCRAWQAGDAPEDVRLCDGEGRVLLAHKGSGVLRATVRAPRHVPAVVARTIDPAAPESEFETVLASGHALTVRVHDALEGEPLADLELAVDVQGATRWRREGTSDSAGEVYLEGLPEAATLRVVARDAAGAYLLADGLDWSASEAVLELGLDRDAARVDESPAALRPSRVVRGLVVDPLGRAAPGARVVRVHGEGSEVVALSGVDGSFSLRVPTDGSVLVAEARGWGQGAVSVPAGRSEAAVRIELAPESRLVVRAPEGSSAGPLRVIDGAGRRRVIPDEGGGVWELRGLAPGIVTLVTAGCVPERVALRAGEPDTTITLAAESRIEGRVLAEGAPRGGVAVGVLFSRDRAAFEQVAAVLTDDHGRFSVAGLAPGRYRAVARDMAMRGELALPVGPEETVTVEVPLAQVALALTVRDAESDALLEGVSFELWPPGAVREPNVRLRGHEAWTAGSLTPVIDAYPRGFDRRASDTRGRARLLGNEVGVHTLRVRRDGYREQTLSVELEAGVTEQEIALVPRDDVELALTLEGEGEPPRAMMICVQGERVVDAKEIEGHGSCAGLQPGTMTLYLRAPGFGIVVRELELPERRLRDVTELRVELEPGAALHAHVPAGSRAPELRDRDNRPWNEIMDFVEPLGGARPRARPGPAGTTIWSFVDLPAGSYTVVSDEGAFGPFALEAGEGREVP